MASRKGFLAKPSDIFPATSETHVSQNSSEGVLELDEAEVWNNFSSNTATHEAKKPLSGLKRASRKVDAGGRGAMASVAPASVPVNIPDWSKILKEDYKEHKKWDSDDDDDEDGGVRVPPHEYLARTRGASLSVHEGIGRTLKGRDLSSVRNAIWKKVGFED